MLVDPVNITIIINIPLLTNVKKLRRMLGHTSLYRKFIKGYVAITAPVEKLLKKDEFF